VLTFDFTIDNSSLNETNPEVSSLTDANGGNPERFAVVYERRIPSTPLTPAYTAVMGQLYQTTLATSSVVNVTTLLGGSAVYDHFGPCIDTDGQRFAVGFTRWSAIFGADSAPYLATLHDLNGTLGVTSLPELLNAYQGPDERMRVTSERSGGMLTPRYMATWHTGLAATGPSGIGVLGSFYYGHSNLSPQQYFATSSPGCGTLQLSASGLPALGQTFTLTLAGASGIPFLMFGNPLASPVSACAPCLVGVDSATATMLQTTSLPIVVPANVNLIGLVFGAQGLDLFAPNGCATPFVFTLSNTIRVTVL
jgi:hypothetical protein